MVSGGKDDGDDVEEEDEEDINARAKLNEQCAAGYAKYARVICDAAWTWRRAVAAKLYVASAGPSWKV